MPTSAPAENGCVGLTNSDRKSRSAREVNRCLLRVLDTRTVRLGRREDPLPASPVLGQLVTVGRRAIAAREVPREILQVGHRGAAPSVDGLAWIADGGHRVAATEEAGEQPALGDRGVLVFVEEYHAIAIAFGPADLRPPLRKRGCEGHLVGEIDDASLPLLVPVGVDE